MCPQSNSKVGCKTGQYQDTTKQTSCTACEEGKLCSAVTANADCAAGEFTQTHQTACESCPKGMTCNDKQFLNTAPCPDGKVNTGGNADCTNAGAGKYSGADA